MGSVSQSLDTALVTWLGQQHVYFVGSAPTDPDGHINVSPKGARETFRVMDPTTIAYLDLTGSGVETISHLQDNGRIVVMFCAFEGAPRIVRLHGRGRVVTSDQPEFNRLLEVFQPSDEALSVLRSVIVVDVSRVADSCGYVVPRMDFVAERAQLFRWGESKRQKVGTDWRREYQREKNQTSIDGLRGLEVGVTPLACAASGSCAPPPPSVR